MPLLNLTITYAVAYQNNGNIFCVFKYHDKYCIFSISYFHALIYAFHCKRIFEFNKSNQTNRNISSLNIPDRAFNYTEYRDGLVSDDFREIKLTRIVPIKMIIIIILFNQQGPPVACVLMCTKMIK